MDRIGTERNSKEKDDYWASSLSQRDSPSQGVFGKGRGSSVLLVKENGTPLTKGMSGPRGVLGLPSSTRPWAGWIFEPDATKNAMGFGCQIVTWARRI